LKWWIEFPGGEWGQLLLLEQLEQVADPVMSLEWVAKVLLAMDFVDVVPAFLADGDEAVLGKFSDNALHGAQSDADSHGNFAERHVRVEVEADEHVAVVGEKTPALLLRSGWQGLEDPFPFRRRRAFFDRHDGIHMAIEFVLFKSQIESARSADHKRLIPL